MEFVEFWKKKQLKIERSMSRERIVFTIICFICIRYIFGVCAIYQSDVKEVDEKWKKKHLNGKL